MGVCWVISLPLFPQIEELTEGLLSLEMMAIGKHIKKIFGNNDSEMVKVFITIFFIYRMLFW
jgi:hypothetical protein